MSIINNNTYYIILTITIILGIYLAYKYREVILRALMLASCVGGLGAFAYSITRDPIVLEKRIEVPVKAEQIPFQKLVMDAASKHGIKKEAIEVLIQKESGGKMNSIKFELHHMDTYAAKITKDKQQQRMYASSHCSMQIMGWHAFGYGVEWSELYDPLTCAEVGVAIFSKCLEKNKHLDNYNKYKNAYKCYNGSDKYAEDAMQKLSKIALNKMF